MTTEIVRTDNPCYLCRNAACRRTFILDYTNQGCAPGIDEKIIDMAMNGSGIREPPACWASVSRQSLEH